MRQPLLILYRRYAPVAYSLLSLVHSLLSKFEPCKSENRVPQPLAPLCGSQTVRHSPYEIKNERLFLDASIRNRLSFFYFAWLKAYSYYTVAGGYRQPNSCAVPDRGASQGRIRRRHDDQPPSPQTADLWQHQNTDDP